MSNPPSASELDQAFQAAIAAHSAGNLEQALSIYDQLLACLPTHPLLLLRRGVLARQMGAKADAIQFLQAAAVQAPLDAEIFSNLGNALADLEDAGARAAHLRAAELANDHVGVLKNTVGFLLAGGDALTAVPLLNRLVELALGDATVWGMLGDALSALRRWPDAVASLRRATAIDPQNSENWTKLGILLYQQGDFGQARAAFEKADQIRPNHPPILTNLGLSLLWAPEALALHERALALDPLLQVARMNRAMHLLRVGDQAEGWRAYEARRQNSGAVVRDFRQPLWQGQKLRANEPLLLWAEQGAGDVFFMLRYLPAAMARAETVILELHPGLAALADGLPAGLTVLERGAQLPAFSHHLSTTSLPRVLEGLDSAPPYVAVPSAAMMRWEAQLIGSKPKIGLVWAGNPLHANDRLRSRALMDFAPLFRHEGIVFYSLQTGSPRDQLAASGLPLIDLADDLTDFAETAAALAQMDLLISVDTAVLNLGGAMGLAAWGLPSPNPDWRWGLSGETSAHYPTLRLFRRLTLPSGDSEPATEVITRLDRAFAEWVQARQT